LVGSDEGSVRLSPLLNQLSVLVEFLKTINIDARDSGFFGLLAMDGISNDTDLHSRLGDVGQLDAALESLIFFGIIIFQADLEFNCLYELSLLLGSQHLIDVLAHGVLVDLAHLYIRF
jgi:hypothetical protein